MGGPSVDIYMFSDYKELLRQSLQAPGHSRGYQAKLANAAGCRASYLSQVLSGEAHLTPDHAAGIADLWKLNAADAEYFLALVHLARAGTQALRRRLDVQVATLRARNSSLTQRLKPETAPPSAVDSVRYYSSWRWLAIHMMLALPGCSDPAVLARRLALPLSVVTDTLDGLIAMGLVREHGGSYVRTVNDMHLPKDDPMIAVGHASWRLNAAERAARASGSNELHYSGVHTLSRADAKHIHALFVAALEKSREIIRPSADEEALCVLVDVFPL